MEKIRLSKRMSELGLCSRREADSYIEKGWVEVDGEVVSELGSKVLPSQQVRLRTAAQNSQQHRVTVLLNKPIGYVSGQAEHHYKPASVLFEAATRWTEDSTPIQFHRSQYLGLAPAGRLDIDSQGLLVLTQDGRIAKRLIGEDSNVDKEYLVRVQGKLDDAGLALLNQGLKLDGAYLKPAKVTWQNEDQLRFVLREGKKRQIRRMCELVGLSVSGLKRIRIGKVKLGNLPVGQWRYLGENEQF
ncbi:MAG: pseudouridine synthase [Gallionella sp.]